MREGWNHPPLPPRTPKQEAEYQSLRANAYGPSSPESIARMNRLIAASMRAAEGNGG